MLCLERKRAERSGIKFALILLDARSAIETEIGTSIFGRIFKAVDATRRETDLAGWYKEDAILGVIFTELGDFPESATSEMLRRKIHERLTAELTPQELQLVQVSLHIFDDDSDDRGSNISNPAFYPDIFHQNEAKKLPLAMKRIMDVIGAAVAITLLSPVFCLIALAVKLTSKGPVLFRQERIGQLGVSFEFLKFRSMYASNSAEIHKTYVRDFISGKTGTSAGKPSEKTVFKIKNDPRVTPVGKFLRRTSLDELPQFWNVLREMSLVGAAPAVPYEIEAYYIGIGDEFWRQAGNHWSVAGFMDAARRLSTKWCAWTLSMRRSGRRCWISRLGLQTPGAVLSGDGAY